MNDDLLGPKLTLGHAHQSMPGGVAGGPAPVVDHTRSGVIQPRTIRDGTTPGPRRPEALRLLLQFLVL